MKREERKEKRGMSREQIAMGNGGYGNYGSV
jgi:hypothetical protein